MEQKEKAEQQHGLSWSPALPDSTRKPSTELEGSRLAIAFLNQTTNGQGWRLHNLLSKMDVFGQGLLSEEGAAVSQHSMARGSGKGTIDVFVLLSNLREMQILRSYSRPADTESLRMGFKVM